MAIDWDDDDVDDLAEDWGVEPELVEQFLEDWGGLEAVDAFDITGHIDEYGHPDPDYMQELADLYDIDISDLYDIYYGYED